MNRKIALLLSAFCAFSAAALELFPLQVVFVRPETPTPVILAVGTPEELATLHFAIVEPPKYGVILGIPPDLVYVPKPGFIGTDWITFLIQTAEGQLLDLGTVQLRVIGPEVFSPAFRFEGNLSFSGPAFAWESYGFVFGLYARFQYLDAQAKATWDQTGFTSFQTVAKIELEGTWPVAWRLPITSTLTFKPATLSLTSWTVDARTTLFGWNFAYYFYYSGADPQTGSYFTLSALGSLDRISLESRVKFATLTPTFSEWLLKLRGPWICENCPIKWELEFLQKKLGFDHVSFTMRDIPIPCPVCEGLQTFLDVKITLTTESKTVEPTLRLVSGFVACVRPLASLVTPPAGLGISGVEVYGAEIRCDLPEGYKARFATSFNPAKDSAVTGYTHFFEVIQFEGPVVPCCGSPGWWQLFFYFSRTSGKIFGLAMADINMYFPLSREVMINARLQAGLVDPSDPTKTWKLSLGWKGLF
ncbi:MAG: Ig-like domain-containing protein [Clostridia bacterium]|nr:Ig-like domain-containing protein [Clostridia bacterium]